MIVFVLAACGGDTTTEEPDTTAPEETTEETTEDADTQTTEEGQVFTLEDLSEYDGQDGNPAYVAVDGVVYDVTDVGAWAGGNHLGGLTAGADLTEEISQSPHGESVLDGLPVVGTLE